MLILPCIFADNYQVTINDNLQLHKINTTTVCINLSLIKDNPYLAANKTVVAISLWFTAITAFPFHTRWADTLSGQWVAHAKRTVARWNASNHG